MKQALITGGGSKFGQKITQELVNAGYFVHLVTGNGVKWVDNPCVRVIPVNWQTLGISDVKSIIANLPDLDLIFFNHNASALNLEKFAPRKIQSSSNWQHSYFVACQLPFYLIHSLENRISTNTKIGWMLSRLIKNPVDDHVGFADYIGNKFTNFCIMRSFSINFPASFFAIHPEGGVDVNSTNKAIDIVRLIDNTDPVELNGNLFSTQGEKLVLTNLT